MPNPYNRKTGKRKKMSFQDGFITVKGGHCATEKEFFLVEN